MEWAGNFLSKDKADKAKGLLEKRQRLLALSKAIREDCRSGIIAKDERDASLKVVSDKFLANNCAILRAVCTGYDEWRENA